MPFSAQSFQGDSGQLSSQQTIKVARFWSGCAAANSGFQIQSSRVACGFRKLAVGRLASPTICRSRSLCNCLLPACQILQFLVPNLDRPRQVYFPQRLVQRPEDPDDPSFKDKDVEAVRWRKARISYKGFLRRDTGRFKRNPFANKRI